VGSLAFLSSYNDDHQHDDCDNDDVMISAATSSKWMHLPHQGTKRLMLRDMKSLLPQGLKG
jgi:hypothetical protein